MQSFGSLNSTTQKEIKQNICKMLNEGLGYRKIIKKLKEKEISISKSTLSYWCNKETQRLRKNSFEPSQSKELSYFIGVMFGDGCATEDKENHDYCIRLDSIDKEFVEKFSFCVTKLINKTNNYPVHKCKNIFSTTIRSKELFEFVKEIKIDFDKAKQFIEENPADFIQGLADSEGCPKVSTQNNFYAGVCVANSTNLNLLNYSKLILLNKFNIFSNIYINHKKGQQDSTINGRLITRTKNVYQLNINKFEKTIIFQQKIGFSIKRKQEKLNDAISIIKNFKKKDRLKQWIKLYTQNKNHHWKRLCIRAPCPGFEPESRP